MAFTELFITGYNTQDLIQKPSFYKVAQGKIEQLAKTCAKGPAIAIGGPAYIEKKLYNAYYILIDGKVANIIMKLNSKRFSFSLFPFALHTGLCLEFYPVVPEASTTRPDHQFF